MVSNCPTRPVMNWSASALEGDRSWRRRVPAPVLDEIRECADRDPQLRDTPEEFDPQPVECPHLAAFSARLRAHLLRGVGFTRLSGADVLSAAERRMLFVGTGSLLGRVLTQYGRMYEIRDRGSSHFDHAIPVSMTNAETGFHTDSSAHDTLPDFIGLLCENPATEGGDSMVSNALAVHDRMQVECPELLELLYGEFVRDVVTPGVPKTTEGLLANRFGIFAPSSRPEGVVFRYMRYWIEKGAERAGRSLTDRQLEAFDTLDARLGSDEHAVTFRLDAGDVVWVNNRFLAHSRTGYRDAPDNQRRLARMWVSAE